MVCFREPQLRQNPVDCECFSLTCDGSIRFPPDALLPHGEVFSDMRSVLLHVLAVLLRVRFSPAIGGTEELLSLAAAFEKPSTISACGPLGEAHSTSFGIDLLARHAKFGTHFVNWRETVSACQCPRLVFRPIVVLCDFRSHSGERASPATVESER